MANLDDACDQKNMQLKKSHSYGALEGLDRTGKATEVGCSILRDSYAAKQTFYLSAFSHYLKSYNVYGGDERGQKLRPATAALEFLWKESVLRPHYTRAQKKTHRGRDALARTKVNTVREKERSGAHSKTSQLPQNERKKA